MKRKKFLALLMAMVVAAGTLTACSSTEPQKDEPKKEEVATNVEKTEKADDTVVKEEPTEINLFVYAVEAFDPNVFPSIKVLEDKLNIKLNYEVPPMSSYNEKLQVTMASGEFPDLIMFPDHYNQVFKDAVKNGVIVPVNQYLESAENLTKNISQVSWDCMKINNDDQIYGVPRSTPFRADEYIVRKDWCENLGITLPEDGIVTKDEFLDIMRKFTFNDPDENGLQDTYGFSFYTDANGNIDPNFFGHFFGLLGWQESDNASYKYMKAMYDQENDTYSELLAFASQCWSEGILDPNSPLNKTTADTLARLKEGSVGIIKDFAGNLFGVDKKLKETNPEAELTYLYVKDDNGEVQGDAYGGGYWFLNAITVAAEGKEQKIIDLLDYMLSDEGWQLLLYGPEGVTWNKVNGEVVVDPDAYSELLGAARNHFTLVRRAGDANFFLPTYYDESQKDLVDKTREWISTSINIAVPSLDAGYVPAAASEASYIDYNNKLLSVITKVVLNNATVDDYKKTLQEWYAHGGKEYVEQMQAFIESKQ